MKMISALVLFLAAHSAFAEVYECTGGTGDVSISVVSQRVLYVTNSECGVRLVYQRGNQSTSLFKGVEANDSDVELCGSAAYISSSIFQRATRVAMTLQGGESQGRYVCTLTR